LNTQAKVFIVDYHSPRAQKIKANRKSERLDSVISKLNIVLSPKPPLKKPTRSPFIAHPQISFSRLAPLQKTSIHKMPLKPYRSKNLNTTYDDHISITKLPPAQDFNFFLTQLLDVFSSPETLTEYFFINRHDFIDYNQFLESCICLGMDQFFSDLLGLFEEIAEFKSLARESFLRKCIEVQNNEIKVKKAENSNKSLSSVIKRILPKSADSFQARMKKIMSAMKLAKNSDEIMERIRDELGVKLTKNDLVLIIDYSKQQNRKKPYKEDLNLTGKLSGSPYNLISSTLGTKKQP
jgi:hypothetical protein